MPKDVLVAVYDLAAVLLYVAIIVALIHKYRRTGDRGFLWLGVPLVILPILGVPLDHWLHLAIDRLASGGRIGFFPFTLVEQGTMSLGSLVFLLTAVRQLVGAGLILVAILMLHRAKPSKTPSRT